MNTQHLQTALVSIASIAVFFLFPAITSAATLSAPPNNLGLVGYWSFEDGSGSTATDFSGSGNDGTLTNMDPATDWVSGKRGTALDFDGSDDYADVGKVGLSGGSTRTISGWVKSSDESQQFWVGLFGFNDGGQSDNSFDLEVSGNSGKYVAHVFGNQWDIAPQSASWHHIAMTYDGSQLKAWFDGKLKVDVSYGALSAKDSFGFAHRNDNNNRWAGKIDEVRVYNRALSDTEIQDLYQSGYSQVNSSRELEDIGGLVGWWTMDGKHIDWNAGTTSDASGSGHEGVFNGGMTNAVSASPGHIGQALSFDGSGDYIATEHFYDTNNLTEVTISSWYKSSSVADQIIIASDRNEYWRLGVGSDGANGVQWTVDSSDKVSTKSKSYFEDGEWHYIAAVFDASLTNDHKLYIDGELDNEWSVYSSGIGSNRVSHTLIGVGSEASSVDGGTGPNDWMDGSLDDVRLYDRALSADEIERIYNATRPSGVNTSQTNKLTDGLVGFWSFDGQDVNLSDSSAEVKGVSGNNNHGDAKNGAKPAIGKLGQGYEFDGSDDYVEILTPSGLSSSDSFTVTAWVDGASQSDNTRIVNYGNTSANQGGFILGQTSSGKIRAYTDAGGGSWNQITGSTSFDDGNWHLIVMTYNGSTDTRQLYLDGEKDGSETHGYDNSPSNPGISLGNRLDSQSEGQKGVVDNVRIYDRALSASEIDKLYQLGN